MIDNKQIFGNKTIIILGIMFIPVLAFLPELILSITMFKNKENYREAVFVVESSYYQDYRGGSDWGLFGHINGKKEMYSLANVLTRVKKIEDLDKRYMQGEKINVLYHLNESELNNSKRVLPLDYSFDNLKIEIILKIVIIYLPPTFILIFKGGHYIGRHR